LSLRNTFKGDGYSNVDLRISRVFRVSEKATLQGIAEAFNLLNTVNVRFFQHRLWICRFLPRRWSGHLRCRSVLSRRISEPDLRDAACCVQSAPGSHGISPDYGSNALALRAVNYSYPGDIAMRSWRGLNTARGVRSRVRRSFLKNGPAPQMADHRRGKKSASISGVEEPHVDRVDRLNASAIPCKVASR